MPSFSCRIFSMPKIVIQRHRKENLKKCSLRGLEGHPLLYFLTYPLEKVPVEPGMVLLAPDGPPIGFEDRERTLLLLDGTWRYAAVMRAQLPAMETRSIPPGWKTAYPRRQEEEQGLASVEAIYAACTLLGWPTEGLLDRYFWREEFLQMSPAKSRLFDHD